MHRFVKFVYLLTKKFPKEEIYGITSQIRRSSMSVILNYIEGYARRKGKECKVYRNFMEISFGSLKETKYLIFFSFEEGFINKKEYQIAIEMSDKISKMVWGIIKK